MTRDGGPAKAWSETLTSQYTGGLWHARYPSGLVTLCGQPAVPNGKGRNWPPSCPTCVETARTFQRIDGSMPARWLPDHGRCAATTKHGARCARTACRGSLHCGVHRHLDRQAAA